MVIGTQHWTIWYSKFVFNSIRLSDLRRQIVTSYHPVQQWVNLVALTSLYCPYFLSISFAIWSSMLRHCNSSEGRKKSKLIFKNQVLTACVEVCSINWSKAIDDVSVTFTYFGYSTSQDSWEFITIQNPEARHVLVIKQPPLTNRNGSEPGSLCFMTRTACKHFGISFESRLDQVAFCWVCWSLPTSAWPLPSVQLVSGYCWGHMFLTYVFSKDVHGSKRGVCLQEKLIKA